MSDVRSFMKKRLLLTLALVSLVCISVMADITPQEAASPEYLINYGYSEATAEQVMIQKNRIEGKPCEPLYEKNHNKFVRFLKNCYSYIDPAVDSEERYHHDIKLSPHYTDL